MEKGEWIKVKPVHCHKRLEENTLVDILQIVSDDKAECKLKMKFKPAELGFFFDHDIDHFPGMLEVCSLRQCALALAHLVYDVPMNYMTILEWVEVKLYNFSEIGLETITISKLLSINKTENKMALILEGILFQGEIPLMKMIGKLIAISPKVAGRIRRKKISYENFANIINIEEKNRTKIVEVHMILDGYKFDEALILLHKVLLGKKVEKYDLLPLYFSYDEEDFEVRICFMFNNPVLLGKFVVEKLRPISGVKKSKVRLTLDGKIFPDGVKALVSLDEKLVSSHIFININTAYDDEALQSLYALQESNGVFPAWCMRDFYEYDREITLRLMGLSRDAIIDYIETKVKIIKGLEISAVKYMKKLVKIQENAKLLSLAKGWANFQKI